MGEMIGEDFEPNECEKQARILIAFVNAIYTGKVRDDFSFVFDKDKNYSIKYANEKFLRLLKPSI